MVEKIYFGEDEVEEIIKDYINDQTYSYAVLIDGDWGIGKTHFIKNRLIEYIKNNDVFNSIKPIPIYISLYGNNSIEEITEQINLKMLSNYLTNKLDFSKKKKPKYPDVISSTSYKIILPFLLKKISINKSNFNDLIDQLNNFENHIIFFDDLERCNIPVTQIFGYINNFIEHKNVKVIIIANEKEIKKGGQSENEEIKKGGQSENIDENSQNKIYNITKEKIIGINILFSPNLDKILKQLIKNNIIDERIKEFLEGQCDKYISYAREKNHLNLRTYLFYLGKIIKFNNVIQEFRSERINSNWEDITIIFDFMYKMSIKLKAENYTTYDHESLEFTEYPDHPIFPILYEFIAFAKFNKHEIKTTLEEYLEQKETENNLKEDPIYVLINWYQHCEYEVLNSVDKVLNNLKKDGYPIKLYPSLLKCLSQLVYYRIIDKKYLNSFEESIIDNLKKQSSIHIDFNYAIVFEKNIELKEIYQKTSSNIIDFIEEKNNFIVKKNINQALEGNDWGNKFIENIQSYQFKIHDKKTILSFLNIQLLEEKIINSNVKQLQFFTQGVHLLYEASNFYEFYYNDQNTIKELKNILYKIKDSNEDKIKNIYIDDLIKYFNNRDDKINEYTNS